MASLKLTRKEFGQLDLIAAHWILYSAIRAGFCMLASMLTSAAVLPQAKELFDELVRNEYDNE